MGEGKIDYVFFLGEPLSERLLGIHCCRSDIKISVMDVESDFNWFRIWSMAMMNI
jgi:hypothetical protein